MINELSVVKRTIFQNSTVSSGINSLSVLALEGFIRPAYKKSINNELGMKISKMLGTCFVVNFLK